MNSTSGSRRFLHESQPPERTGDRTEPCMSDGQQATSEEIALELQARLDSTMRPGTGGNLCGPDACERTVRSLLLDPHTPLETIRRIKAQFQDIAGGERAGPCRQAVYLPALTVYYAAIAAGLAHHDRKLTSYSLTDLATSLEALAARAWMDRILAELLHRACDICRELGDRMPGSTPPPAQP